MRSFSVTIFSLLVTALSWVPAHFTQAQTVYNTVPVSGFTDDVVANLPGPAKSSATNDMDGGNAPTRFCFVTQNYRNPSGDAPSTYLPANGFFTSKERSTPGLSFQLAGYDANNTLRIHGTGTGTLTFTVPQAARTIFLLGGSGNSQQGPTNFIATINFTDGTSQAFTNLFFMDWFGLLDVVALQGVSRVNYDTNVIENSTTDPSLYQKRLALLPANYGKLIRSITINKPGAYGTLNVLAVSAGVGCPAPPAAGKAVASVTNICAPTSVNLSLTGAATDTDLTYQWQESTDNGTTWTDVSGATKTTFTATPTTTTQYRAKVNCATLTGTSVPVTVTLTLLTPQISYKKAAYCQLGLTEAPVAGPKGGTFSGTNGLVINAKTGIIDLTESTRGQHTITYTTAPPCVEKITTKLEIEGSPEILLPNIITANGDDKNEGLLVKVPDLTAYNLQVYNRWGSLVWENNDPTQGWTGAESAAGIYYYLVRFADCTGEQRTFKSWVELIK
ncbi:gliding motility-associated C-terminal domain-containing protein [Adhaeribacter sp. BT258]|uniref:Gliding motility-associated C-terminal domain-containing protein n=1 Tax=Adhaeribacter terrigena TaxID=2793070 RepID=A0ABS1C2C9_9BACT|nr:gliding motility-associated C-terminal domain-containing protein [Adhaeribacter terrigena]MBK0403312.1 gliding motility-associated C-terminal domain-containing protein [Adhaeribacter terrigena]